MPRVYIDLEEQELKEILRKTKRNLKEGIEGIVREFLKQGKSLDEISKTERFKRLLEETFQSHFDRLLERLIKEIKTDEKRGECVSVSEEEVKKVVEEFLG